MKPIIVQKAMQNWKKWTIAAVVVLAVGGGLSWFFLGQKTASASQGDDLGYNTSPVRNSSIILSASGTGTLIAGKETNLAFSTDGVVGTLNVVVGDKVQEGDVLAELLDQTSLQVALQEAQVNLTTAQKALDDLEGNTSAAIAEAQLAVADAKEAYNDAKSALKWEGLQRCDDDTTEAYYENYMQAQEKVDGYGQIDYSSDIYLNEIKPLIQARDQAYATYTYCAGFTEYEISSSQAELVTTQAALNEAQAKLEELQANNGIDETEMTQAEIDVENAKLALEQAQKNLAGAKLVAPYDGTVLSIEGEAGDEVEAGTFITVADMAHPQVEFYVDETDLDMVQVGYEAEVVFDALPDETFTGTVVQVDPTLETSMGASVLQGLVRIELTPAQELLTLPKGLSAAVEIIGGKAENVLVVPVEAIHDLGDGTYGVFVLENGQPRLRTVEVGLMDLTYVEIQSGLEMGDVVTTGQTEVNG
ncbi:MAG: efflux RND transporter periplasmic adaptor subunit [Chloroflexi bacterium]|nr:efflux RND transporter periplasmic adaptor subunit [Chloroflexota bacterium]